MSHSHVVLDHVLFVITSAHGYFSSIHIVSQTYSSEYDMNHNEDPTAIESDQDDDLLQQDRIPLDIQPFDLYPSILTDILSELHATGIAFFFCCDHHPSLVLFQCNTT